MLWACVQRKKAARHANHAVLVGTELDARLVLLAGIERSWMLPLCANSVHRVKPRSQQVPTPALNAILDSSVQQKVYALSVVV